MVRLSRTASALSVLLGPLLFILFATPQCAVAQGTDLAPRALVSSPAKSTSNPKAAGQPANSLIDTAAIVERLNQELGIDLGSIIAGWQHELDRIEHAARAAPGIRSSIAYATNCSGSAPKSMTRRTDCNLGSMPTRRR